MRYVYGPGDWMALTSNGAAALLPPDLDVAAAERVWALLVAGAPMAAWVDALAPAGLSSMPVCALVETGTDGVRVLVRGGVTAEIGSVAVSGAGLATWREHVEPGAVEVTLRVDGPRRPAAYPVAGGVVFAASVTVGPREEDPAPALGTVAGQSVADQLGLGEPAQPEPPVQQAAPASPAAPVSPEPAVRTGAHARVPEPAEPVGPAPVTVPVPTGILPDAEWQPNPQVPDTTLIPHEDEPAPEAYVLTLSTGVTVPLDQPVLIGRAPEAGRFDGASAPRLLTVPSPLQDISRTHVEIRLEGDGVLVTDLRSTNGTVVIPPGLAPRRLHAGEGVRVPAGTVVDLGDGLNIQVNGA